MRRHVTRLVFALVSTMYLHPSIAADVSFSGYLDSDVWTNFAGNFFTNDELDVGMTISFSEAVQAHLYTTVRAGVVPARLGEPGSRWASLAFDGVDITFKTKFGEFAVGDLVYQYGKFNYYFYK